MKRLLNGTLFQKEDDNAKKNKNEIYLIKEPSKENIHSDICFIFDLNKINISPTTATLDLHEKLKEKFTLQRQQTLRKILWKCFICNNFQGSKYFLYKCSVCFRKEKGGGPIKIGNIILPKLFDIDLFEKQLEDRKCFLDDKEIEKLTSILNFLVKTNKTGTVEERIKMLNDELNSFFLNFKNTSIIGIRYYQMIMLYDIVKDRVEKHWMLEHVLAKRVLDKHRIEGKFGVAYCYYNPLFVFSGISENVYLMNILKTKLVVDNPWK
ncbi:hypothetical protein ABK040_011114 [Willaertia magna]